MAGPFEIATKVAIKEIIQNHTTESKFGAFLSEEALNGAVSELYDLVVTSRNLKASGDKLLAGGLGQEQGNFKRD